MKLSESEEVLHGIDHSVEVLAKHLAEGEMVYGLSASKLISSVVRLPRLTLIGVNTGFGGSADVRTNALRLLQKGLVQHQNSALLSPHDLSGVSTTHGAASNIQSKAMPTAWVRGLMLARLNSIIRGHSAVSMPIIEMILAFLEHDITPIIPKRGSISARYGIKSLQWVLQIC